MNQQKSQHGASLSLLSRGVGDLKRQITNLVHEKVEVHLEPQDYYNLNEQTSHSHEDALQSHLFDQDAERVPRAHVPKTFTTRRGALLLFSEDYGAQNRVHRRHHHSHKRFRHRRYRTNPSSLGAIDFSIPEEPLENGAEDEDEEGLRTVDDLTRSILSYGSREPDDVHLHFVHPRRPHKIVRPGFSARRYLASLSHHFDPTFVDKMLSTGRLSEKTLFQQSAFMPHIRRRIKDDLSLYPPPYRIMRQMLLAPGPLNEFSFVWNRREKTEPSLSMEEELELLVEGDIKVVERENTVAGEPSREVSYAELDVKTQRSVLSNLLVKSAINHAIRRQEELENKPMSQIDEKQELSSVPQPPGMFDMITAVKSLLDTETEMDTLPPVHTGFRGRALRGRPTESTTSSSRITPLHSYAASRSMSRTTTPPRGASRRGQELQFLPPMTHGPMVSMPINDVPEERERHEVPIVNLTMAEEAEEKEAESEVTLASQNTGGPAVATLGFMVPQFTTHVQPRVPSRMRPSPARLQPLSPRPEEREEQAPGHVGKVTITFEGTAMQTGPLSAQRPQIVSTAREKKVVRPTWKRLKLQDLVHGEDEDESEVGIRRAVTGKTALSEKIYGYPSEEGVGAGGGPLQSAFTGEDLMQLLTGHADRVAERVLNTESGGVDLAKDVKAAAELWTQPKPSQAVDSLSGSAVQEAIKHIVMQREQAGSRLSGALEGVEERPESNLSQDEYKDLIKEALRSVVAQSAPGVQIPSDMELSDEVLGRLTSAEGLLADELVITQDPETGNSVLRIRKPSMADGVRTHVVSRPKYALNLGAAGAPTPQPGTVLEEIRPGSELSSSVGSMSSAMTGPSGSRASGRGVPRRLFEAGKDKASAVMRTTGEPTTISEERTGLSRGDVLADAKIATEAGTPALIGGGGGGAGGGGKPREGQPTPAVGSESPEGDARSPVSQKSTVSRPGVSQQNTLGERKKTLDREEFVVGKVNDKEELKRLYGQLQGMQPKEGESTRKSSDSPTKPKKPPVPKASEAKKKKSKAKKKKSSISKPVKKPSKASKEEKEQLSTQTLYESAEADRRSSEASEGDYHLIDEEFSDEEGETEGGKPVYPRRKYYPVPKPKESVTSQEDEEEARLRRLSLRDQREARRRADAEKRRAEMERRRREREEKKRLEVEEMERQKQMEAEFEEERQRREEEFRQRKQREREERENAEEAVYQADLARQRHKEREQREREELLRRMEAMRRQHEEEEERKRLEEEERQKEEEARLQAEKEMLAFMAEEERVEYERKKKEEEERRKREEEEARIKREEEARLAMEEARRLAEEMARQKASLEARNRFLKSLHLEYIGLMRSSRISQAHVWSYFDLLQWLGLELPEFEGKKGR